jgi:23S rRNA (pseudouridine1915-N3)-methyltransferase
MRITLAFIAPARSQPKTPEAAKLIDAYLTRASRYAPCEARAFPSEPDLLAWIQQQHGRAPVFLALLDSRGQQLSSEDLAQRIGRLRDSATQHLVFAIGPADGWSPAAHARATLLLSLGLMTLPHELARLVLAEQLYRALTILAGHPYHSGH